MHNKNNDGNFDDNNRNVHHGAWFALAIDVLAIRLMTVRLQIDAAGHDLACLVCYVEHDRYALV
eukprot:scaffold20110_cov19-Prasinocladus_malaysianus.AAC.1